MLGHGLVFQPVIVTQTCTYNSNNIITLQNTHITDFPSPKNFLFQKEHNNPPPPSPPPTHTQKKHPKTHNNNNRIVQNLELCLSAFAAATTVAIVISSFSVFPSYTSGFYHFGQDFCVCDRFFLIQPLRLPHSVFVDVVVISSSRKVLVKTLISSSEGKGGVVHWRK